MVKLQLVFVVFIAICINGGIVKASQEYDMWLKLNPTRNKVCFEGRGNKPGTLIYEGEDVLIFSMKLVHKSGRIRCAASANYNSLWGCYHNNHHVGLKRYPLNVVVTDSANHVIYPQPKFFHPYDQSLRSAMWYYLPATDSVHSKELVFSDYKEPFYLRKGCVLRVWYGEDLADKSESDNYGKVCVDVFALATVFY